MQPHVFEGGVADVKVGGIFTKEVVLIVSLDFSVAVKSNLLDTSAATNITLTTNICTYSIFLSMLMSSNYKYHKEITDLFSILCDTQNHQLDCFYIGNVHMGIFDVRG